MHSSCIVQECSMAEARWGKKPVCEFSCCFALISHNDLQVLKTGFGSKVVAFLWLLSAGLVRYYSFWRLSSIWWIGPSWESALLNALSFIRWHPLGGCFGCIKTRSTVYLFRRIPVWKAGRHMWWASDIWSVGIALWTFSGLMVGWRLQDCLLSSCQLEPQLVDNLGLCR